MADVTSMPQQTTTTAESENETNIRRGLDVIQSMIDISADRLEGLRTQCATSAELTQQEIRTLEAKLVKMFSELLITKAKLPERLPKGLPATGAELKQWLRVVGLSPESLNMVMQRVTTLEILLDKTDVELRAILNNNANVRDEEIRRLLRAMFNLKRCRQAIKEGNREPIDLFWDSWDRHHHIHHHRTGASPRTHRVRYQTSATAQHYFHTTPPVPQSLSRLTAGHSDAQSPIELSPPDSIATQSMPMHTISPEELTAITPSPSPPSSPSILILNNKFKGLIGRNVSGSTGGGSGSSSSGIGVPTTPPPKKKHQTTLQQLQQQQSPVILQNVGDEAIAKSRSQESQLSAGGIAGSIETADDVVIKPLATQLPTPRTRLHTEPSPENFNDIVDTNHHNHLPVPRSPCTPIVSRGMGHVIAHRFTKKFKVMSTCDLCNKQMFFGLKCKECKYRCHKDCEPNVPPSCGLPPEFVDEFKRSLGSDVFLATPTNSSPNMPGRGTYLLSTARRDRHRTGTGSNQHAYGGMGTGGGGGGTLSGSNYGNGGPDSSSAGSSCNSSSPSSPALLTNLQPQTPAANKHTQFNFPDITSSGGGSTAAGVHYHPRQHHYLHHHHHQLLIKQQHVDGGLDSGRRGDDKSMITADLNPPSPLVMVTKPQPPPIPSTTVTFSDLTDTHRSNDSDKTVSLSGSTSASTDSDRTPIRLDSTEERDSGHWPRQNSLSLKEWDIPFDDLHLLEKIGRGRFGTVHRALWHGDVAVKLLKEDYLDDERTLEAFKLEVATFKKTRHENVVLFMGACMKPQAIVTSLCKGNTLYTHIHLRKDKFNLNRTTLVAQQISQGMGYLHARGIVHKDLKTKNIFLENGKVIITDFGLFSATKLQYCEELGLGIPNGWLCYLAPELIRCLRSVRPSEEELPFSKASDIYAFGTVWYELLCGEFPFKRQPPEAVIFQVGCGMKQTLANLQASRDVKDILMLCWSYQADDRPDFPKLLTDLERLPKKRLARSPSHPVQLSRSAESVF